MQGSLKEKASKSLRSPSLGALGCFAKPVQRGQKVRGTNQQKSASLYNTSKKVTTSTYQADQNEKNKCYFSEDRPARYVAVACERKGCAFMQIKQPSTYLLWTLWPWENRHSPSMQDHAPRPLGNNWQNREGRRYFQATNKNKGDEKGLSQWMVNWSMLMLICWIYIIYIIATKKHTCIIAWSTKFFTKTMHFLYHSYCYAVLSGCLLLLVLGQSLFVPQPLQGGVGKGVWVWGKVDNFTEKREN